MQNCSVIYNDQAINKPLKIPQSTHKRPAINRIQGKERKNHGRRQISGGWCSVAAVVVECSQVDRYGAKSMMQPVWGGVLGGESVPLSNRVVIISSTSSPALPIRSM